MQTNRAIEYNSILPELLLEATQYRLAQFDREDRSHPGNTTVAQNVLSSTFTTAHPMSSRAGLGQSIADAFTVRHESSGFLDRSAIGLSTVLALMPNSAINTFEIKNLLHHLRAPGHGLGRVFV